MTDANESLNCERLKLRHLRFGWGLLLCFLTLGLVLEVLHGFKVGWYLNVSNETRRLMWTLAHAHGVLLGLVNIAFGLTCAALPAAGSAGRRFASVTLMSAAVLLPCGFLLGGIVVYGGDPGVGVLLVPVGGLLLFVGVFAMSWSLCRSDGPSRH